MAALICGMCVGAAAVIILGRQCSSPAHETGTIEIVSRRTVTDTVHVRQVRPDDSLVVRYEAALPLASDSCVPATVEVPISRVEYADTSYRAVIEGYRPRLVSLDFYRPVETVTLVRSSVHRPRIVVGPYVGIGYDPVGRRLAPTVGVAVTVPLWAK